LGRGRFRVREPGGRLLHPGRLLAARRNRLRRGAGAGRHRLLGLALPRDRRHTGARLELLPRRRAITGAVRVLQDGGHPVRSGPPAAHDPDGGGSESIPVGHAGGGARAATLTTDRGVALITGASAGNGRATPAQLAPRGPDLIL